VAGSAKAQEYLAALRQSKNCSVDWRRFNRSQSCNYC
jgi:hypothetical protein